VYDAVTMTASLPRKWRPSLSMIVFVVLATVAALPLLGLFFFRLYENQFIRQTEAELIGQTTVLAATFAMLVKDNPALQAQVRPTELRPLTPDIPPAVGPYHPIEPRLDLASDDILPRRPEAQATTVPVDPAFLALGAKLSDIAASTQDRTLAGFRLLDPNGLVIGGSRDEQGRSLANVQEVAAALSGRYASVLRTRLSRSPTPPIYSVSRGTALRIFVAMPVIVDQGVAGVVYASRTPNNVVRHLYGERRKLILAGLALVVVVSLIGFLFSRTITRPIHGLIAQTATVGRDGRAAEASLSHYGTREVAALADSFHAMAQRLSERSAYLSTFAAHVSHELKSPLTAIQGAAELMRDAANSPRPMEPAQQRRFLDNMIADTTRLAHLLERLRELARADNPQGAGSTRLGPVLADVRAAYPALSVVWTEPHEGTASDIRLGLSAEDAGIVFGHLADNALRHGARHLTIGVAATAPGLVLTVADDGEGISPNNRDKVFDTFFTTRRESGGTGMGLGIVRSMLASHGGTISLDPSGPGATFRLTLPG
jgi:signal transduction histidine kinase